MRKEFGTFEIEPHEFEFHNRIGSGSFGDVYKGKCRGKEVALKKLKGQELTPEQLDELRKEVEIMSQLYHPNIVLFMGACFRRGHMTMVTELMPEGSVSDLLRNPKMGITVLQKLVMGKHTCLGMNWLHTRNPTVLHRDLKPANLLVDKDWNVKVCDFGLSTAVERGKKWEDEDDIPGTPLWMAPEVMLGKQIDGKADVYSYALCIWEFFSIEEPYSQFTNFNDFRKAIAGRHVRPEMPASMPASVASLTKLCWDPDPAQRPTFDELLLLMDNLIIEVTIREREGQEWWKETFRTEGGEDSYHLEVGWDRFIKAFVARLGLTEAAIDEPGAQCVRNLIARPSTHPTGDPFSIKVEAFGNFLSWFGPLNRATAKNPKRFIDPLHKVEELCSWKPKKKQSSVPFHGDVSSQQAEELLAGQDKGTFLLRASAKDLRTPFVISKVSRQGAINHQRITFDAAAGVFKIDIRLKNGTKTVTSVDDSLVDFVKSVMDDLYLKYPCPGSRFASIFTAATLQGYLAE